MATSRDLELFSLVDAVREDDVKLRIVVGDPSTLI